LETVAKFSVQWSSPSNIALVKYWGKRPVQLPANPSVSFTLSHSISNFNVTAFEKTKVGIEVDFLFENNENLKFQDKIVKFLQNHVETFSWIDRYKLVIQSTNTFPHSSGIASSASSMSALCLSLLSLDELITGKKRSEKEFLQEASRLSRLASGSAGRSVYPYMATWGVISEDYATPVSKTNIHSDFHNFCDSILIVDAGEKSVSSRAGHSLMETHPFKDERFKRARVNLDRLMVAMKDGDMKTFIEVVEEEALMLHALMMTSTPSYILLRPGSLDLIEKIRAFRERTQVPVCFTIDAGPNIHLLYPALYKDQVHAWLETFFPAKQIIHDEVGAGPKRHNIL
jgi:diphosphomevalonate decarboxylase